jgi:hypothetical protein
MEEGFEKKLILQINNISKDLHIMLKNIKQIYDPNFLHKLNISIVKLTAFEKIYEKEERRAKIIVNTILDQIKADAD